jgi:DNA-binding transcriptional MocR family regulator
MFFWVTLPEGTDAEAMLAEALEVGVAYVKGAAFYTEGVSGRNCFRLNFSQPSPARIETGINRLADIIEAKLSVKA